MNRKKRNFWVIVLIIAVIIAFLCASYFVLRGMDIDVANILTNSNDDSTSDSASDNEIVEITTPEINVELAENPIDFDSLAESNSEIYSWIYIPDTNINYPVCQSLSDDNFYLDHDVYKNYKFSGTIYSQSCNSTDYSDRVTVLYGHNMANGSMFANLHKFSDEDFFESHEYFYIYTPNHKLTYKVVSAYAYDDRHIMNSFDFSDDDVFQDYLDYMLSPRSTTKIVRDSVELTTDDKIVTLSTCTNSGSGRYLVQGVLEKDELTK